MYFFTDQECVALVGIRRRKGDTLKTPSNFALWKYVANKTCQKHKWSKNQLLQACERDLSLFDNETKTVLADLTESSSEFRRLNSYLLNVPSVEDDLEYLLTTLTKQVKILNP